jgi:aldose 1-epimerase
MLRLEHDELTVMAHPESGGRIDQIEVHGTPVLIDEARYRRNGGTASGLATMQWGIVPMVPWAGRVRAGRVLLDGTSYQLPVVHGGHAIHGVGHAMSWDVDDLSDRSLTMTLVLPSDERWPFGGVVTHLVWIDDGALVMELTLSASGQALPVSFGWHPWFIKPERFEMQARAMYRRDADGIATSELVEVPPGPWDDCFIVEDPIEVSVAGIGLQLSSSCNDWVVFDEPETSTCIEPQTGPPDAFTIKPLRLGPGESRTERFRIAVM